MISPSPYVKYSDFFSLGSCPIVLEICSGYFYDLKRKKTSITHKIHDIFSINFIGYDVPFSPFRLFVYVLRCSYDYLEIIDSHPLEQQSYVGNMTDSVDSWKHMQTPIISSDQFGSNPNRTYKDADIFENFLSIYKAHHSYLIQTPIMGITSQKATNVYAPRRICGDWNSKVKLLRYQSSGPILGLHFSSDYSHHFGGYKAKIVIKNGEYILYNIPEFTFQRY